MSEIICHNKGRYNLYNTVTDGFRFVESIDLVQLKELVKEEAGEAGLVWLPHRLERAHKWGFSAVGCGDFASFLRNNEAGEDGKELTVDQCIDEFLT